MSRIVRAVSDEFRPFPSGYYKVELSRIEDAVSRHGEAYHFWFKVLQAMKFIGTPQPHEIKHLVGRPFYSWVSDSRARNSNLFRIVRILTGREISVGEDFDLDELVGKTCYVDAYLSKGYIVKVTDYFNEEEFSDVVNPNRA